MGILANGVQGAGFSVFISIVFFFELKKYKFWSCRLEIAEKAIPLHPVFENRL